MFQGDSAFARRPKRNPHRHRCLVAKPAADRGFQAARRIGIRGDQTGEIGAGLQRERRAGFAIDPDRERVAVVRETIGVCFHAFPAFVVLLLAQLALEAAIPVAPIEKRPGRRQAENRRKIIRHQDRGVGLPDEAAFLVERHSLDVSRPCAQIQPVETGIDGAVDEARQQRSAEASPLIVRRDIEQRDIRHIRLSGFKPHRAISGDGMAFTLARRVARFPDQQFPVVFALQPVADALGGSRRATAKRAGPLQVAFVPHASHLGRVALDVQRPKNQCVAAHSRTGLSCIWALAARRLAPAARPSTERRDRPQCVFPHEAISRLPPRDPNRGERRNSIAWRIRISAPKKQSR
ncbi:MAG: hypothetical protein BWZ10_03050 [candidate division BRC1 bacterium ADurb.BinA364]|nr:MAG: hypothetical protein BWZ10_03050 [candidate division BRC1 bacterium ADurb.BinA364]